MPKLAANLTMMFNEVDFLDRFDAAADAGFKGVEYLFPYDYDKEQLTEKLKTNNLTQVLHNLPAGDWEAGERGIACDPNRIGEFLEGVERAIDYATSLDCKQVNCLAGIAPDSVEPQVVRDTFVANLKFASQMLREAGIRLLIEPINTRDIPGFYLQNTDQALSIMDEVDSRNLSLQYDVYHMQIMEGDLTSTLEANLARIRHVQIADNPGRNEPGTGEINYPFLFKAIDDMGYRGWIGCEYNPATTTVEGLSWAARYLDS